MNKNKNELYLEYSLQVRKFLTLTVEFMSTSTTLVLPNLFLLLRTNMLQKYGNGGAIHPKQKIANIPIFFKHNKNL